MVAKNILVTGCNRGLGYEIVKQLASAPSKPNLIIATCRDPDNAEDLKNLADLHPCIVVAKFDVADKESYASFVKYVEELVAEDGLNLLINNAAIISKPSDLENVKWEQMLDAFQANSVAPLILSQALLPLLKVAAKKLSKQEMSVSRAAIINISSLMGSLDDNTSGGNYSYRCSKAALNMLTKSLSVDLLDSGILAVVIHPGWVKTRMGGPNALISPEESISKMMQTIWKFREKDSGKFVRIDGTVLPW